MKDFKLNGKKVTPKPITFNTICDLEDRGFDISEMGTHTMSFIRVFVALWEKISIEKAGDEIEAHINNGGDIAVLMDAITDAINESGFFKGAGNESPDLKIVEATESDS